jgi:hypothetical protein
MHTKTYIKTILKLKVYKTHKTLTKLLKFDQVEILLLLSMIDYLFLKFH